MKTATFVKSLRGFTGDARLYRLSEPMSYGYGEDEKTTEYVVVSATHAMFSGPETYIFPADADGKVINWSEMEGSFRGALDHEEALSGAGYTLASA